jgi:phosphoglucosamine mutase
VFVCGNELAEFEQFSGVGKLWKNHLTPRRQAFGGRVRFGLYAKKTKSSGKMVETMSSKPELFGTDGIRGVAGRYPLDRPTVWRIGCALGKVLAKQVATKAVRVVLGEDTRESSVWVSKTLAAGLKSASAEVVYAGVITTPGIAFLTHDRGFDAGVVVSASHNPYADNGIKVLSSAGTKLSESVELEIEREVNRTGPPGSAEQALPLNSEPRLLARYLEHLLKLAPATSSLSKFRLVLDCAHGAACSVAPALCRRLGMEARVINAEPNGRNINAGCGSLHPQSMAEATQSVTADLGVAFDGDADRAIFATREGRLADGDHVLFGMAPYLQQRGQLKGGAIVGTLMTNLALELALARHGIGLKRAAVGDKYVLEEMLRSGINLGGEPSGHIIFADLSLAGDGMITLLQVLGLLAETGQPFDGLVRGLRPFPQIIRNVRVREKPPLESIPEVASALRDCLSELGERGRVVVRYSGTEPLARVMVEAEEQEAVERHSGRIASAIEEALGTR